VGFVSVNSFLNSFRIFKLPSPTCKETSNDDVKGVPIDQQASPIFPPSTTSYILNRQEAHKRII
jgi:hypothetical protein